MFCSQCGVKASGKFCHECGSPLHSAAGPLELTDQDFAVPSGDWELDAQYDNVMRVEPVRTAIARQAASAAKGISGEQVLAIYDQVMSSPIPLEKLAAVVQPLYESWGIRTGKERSEIILAPIGRGIALVLCSFARHCQEFQGVEQHDSGCVLTANLPSSACSLKGQVAVSLVRRESQTAVGARTNISGQMYDWGKSRRCLDQLFSDLHGDLGLPPSPHQRRVA